MALRGWAKSDKETKRTGVLHRVKDDKSKHWWDFPSCLIASQGHCSNRSWTSISWDEDIWLGKPVSSMILCVAPFLEGDITRLLKDRKSKRLLPGTLEGYMPNRVSWRPCAENMVVLQSWFSDAFPSFDPNWLAHPVDIILGTSPPGQVSFICCLPVRVPLLPCPVVAVWFLSEPMFKSLHSGYSACVASVVQTPICHIGVGRSLVVEACSHCHMLHGCRERAWAVR